MPDIKFYFRTFTNEFNLIAQRGREKGLKDEAIEKIQEEYMLVFLFGILKPNNMPLEVKYKILEKVKEKLGAASE